MRHSVEELVAGIRGRDRVMLARAITLIESSTNADRAHARELLDALLPERENTTRVAISGPPGAGKSTLINKLTAHVLSQGRRVAVLAIDPTSARSGGALLGDRTRMTDLGLGDDVYMRSSATGLTLGGVAQRTRDVMVLCEAAGFDTVFIETVGVGQSEIAAADMVDCFMLLLAPGGGDELQAIKAGIVEHADIVGITKADGDLLPAAKRMQVDYRNVLGLGHGRVADWSRPVLLTSSETGLGLDELWQQIGAFETLVTHNGMRAQWRTQQRLDAMHSAFVEMIAEDAERRAAELDSSDVVQAVIDGTQAPLSAAAELVERARSRS